MEAEQKEKEEKNTPVEKDTKGLKTTFITYSFTCKHSATRSHSYELGTVPRGSLYLNKTSPSLKEAARNNVHLTMGYILSQGFKRTSTD